jgi:hypothetical protein
MTSGVWSGSASPEIVPVQLAVQLQALRRPPLLLEVGLIAYLASLAYQRVFISHHHGPHRRPITNRS